MTKIPGFQGNLENTAAYAAGIKAGYEMQGRQDITVLGMAGDGATVDIGLQSLSGALERGDKILYICYDNEAYMNTGVQEALPRPPTPGPRRPRQASRATGRTWPRSSMPTASPTWPPLPSALSRTSARSSPRPRRPPRAARPSSTCSLPAPPAGVAVPTPRWRSPNWP